MSAAPKRPKTINRLQRLITDWEGDSGLPVRRLNLRVGSMMLAGALARAIDDDGSPVFLTRGGVAMELRVGDKARVTRDVDFVLRGDPSALIAHLDAAFAEDFEEFSFERDEPEPLELRPQVRRVRVKTSFRTKPFMTVIVEVAPVEAGGEEMEHLPAHDLAAVGLDGPDVIPVLASPWQIAQKLHAVTEPPLRPDGGNPRYWDLVDLQILQAMLSGGLAPVKDACVRTFNTRAQQSWPPRVTTYSDWPARYATMARSLDMPVTDLDAAIEIVHDFIQSIDDAGRVALARPVQRSKFGPEIGPETSISEAT